MKKLHAGMPAGYKKWYDNVLYCLSVGNLYGHLVAGKNWYMTMRKWHLDHGFVQSEYDPCAFHKTKGDSCLTILFYVDDVLAFLWGGEGESDDPRSLLWDHPGSRIPDPGFRIPHI